MAMAKQRLTMKIAQRARSSHLQKICKYKKHDVGRRVIRWTFYRGLTRSLVCRFMAKLEEEMRTSFYLRHSYFYRLCNVETGKSMRYSKSLSGSHRLCSLEEAAEMSLTTNEQQRLAVDDVDRPNNKWTFKRFSSVQTKMIIDRQPLLGTGSLPDWLRRKNGMYSLDTYRDNLCLFRCLAVHKGAVSDRSTERARELAKEFFGATEKVKDIPGTSLDQLEKVEEHFKMGIRVYEPTENGEWHLIRHPAARYGKLQTDLMTIGVYERHAFLITNISKLANVYVCGRCQQRLTKSCSLQKHAKVCTEGATTIKCPGKQVLSPQSAYEMAFYPRPVGRISAAAVRWLEAESRRRGVHIHHQLCGHGGERWIANAPVDGYDPINKTVYQFHGCHWHGCVVCFPSEQQRNVIVYNYYYITREKSYEMTLERDAKIRQAGYELVVMWGHQRKTLRPQFDFKSSLQTAKTMTFPHAIVYRFLRNSFPISVSIADTLDRRTENICNTDPKVFIGEFMNALERRAALIRADVKRCFLSENVDLLSKKQRRLIEKWHDQVPVVGFNSHFKMIKRHFIEQMTDDRETFKVIETGNRTICIMTAGYRFLDVTNYIGPGASYDQWVEAYGCAQTKSSFPYKWFDSPKKLDYPGLPDYPAWQTGTLSLEQWHDCKRVFDEHQMCTFGDWLRYYNNLDVEPFVEALLRMRKFYTDRGVDMFKDAVSLPDVSLQYLLRGTLVGRNAPKLHAPTKEAYEMLRTSLADGPSLVFTRYHEAGVTCIRSHQYDDARPCKRILRYDANALYLSTLNNVLPCGKETVIHFACPQDSVDRFKQRLECGAWFGFAEVDIEVPRYLWSLFEEMPPLFYNKVVPEEAVPPEMLSYLRRTGRTRQANQTQLVGALAAKKILLYAPLLTWYIEHGLVITAVHRTIDYRPRRIFGWFVDQITDARRTVDQEKEKALLDEMFELFGNSGYSKFVENQERRTNTRYTRDEKVVDRAMRSVWFDDLDEIGDAYEIRTRQQSAVITRPFQLGVAINQLAKLRMLEFYYDFLDRSVDRRDYELILLDTDSMYLAISGSSLKDVVCSENCCTKWLARDDWTPGLFKLKFEGHRVIALCSTCYVVDDETKTKHSPRHNALTWITYRAALRASMGTAEKRTMHTYHQHELGLNAYYEKRRVLPDGVHTEPLEYAIKGT